MDKIENLSSITQFNARRGQETLHPLVRRLGIGFSPRFYQRYCSWAKNARIRLFLL
jgi:hypothetical protein